MFSNSLFSLFLFVSVCVCVKSVTVFTENGALSGTTYTTAQGRSVYAFLGIPYAKPPIHEYRFEEPKPAEKWVGLRLAQEFSPRCIQFTYYEQNKDPIIGDEDCLYLNVFTPKVSNISKLNVIFYIHGGAFMFGGGDMFNPDYILDCHDVVFVSINYRLGPFGFLALEDGIIPGNNGLKDQVMALKWVQDNIEQFGGDRHKVTVAGLSAGGASVHLLYFSRLSRNLFSQGISLSGSAFCPWVFAENTYEKAKVLGNSVGCQTEDSSHLASCLRLREARRLLSQTKELFMPWNYNPFSPFGVVIEDNSRSAFLSENPYEMLVKGDVKDAPWLISITTEEGLYPGASFVNNEILMQELNKNWDVIAPHLLDYNFTVPKEQLNEVSGKIRKFYLGNEKITIQNRKELIKLIGDRLFVVDIERAARLQASVSKSHVYFLSFGYRGKYSLSELLCKCKEHLGASHGDDLLYVLRGPEFLISPLETKEDSNVAKVMVDIWITFVQSGIPSAGPKIEWTSVSSDVAAQGNLTYLTINSGNNIKLLSAIELTNRRFWNDLPFHELWGGVKCKKRDHDEL